MSDASTKTTAFDRRLIDARVRAMQIMDDRAARKILRAPLFHGTRRATSIKSSGFRPSTGGEFGPGIYLTEFAPTAEFYALRVASGPEEPSVIQCRVSITNPFVVTKTDWIALTASVTPGTVQRRLVATGHDGIVGLGLTGAPQVVAFASDQVKYSSVRKI